MILIVWVTGMRTCAAPYAGQRAGVPADRCIAVHLREIGGKDRGQLHG